MIVYWQKGDWCFHEFKLKEITEVKEYSDGNAITEVSDGYFSTHGQYLNDRCYPLTLKIKLISENFEYFNNLLHKVENIEFKRNFPNIHREIVRKWCECCDDEDDTEKIQKHYVELEEWYFLTVGGIKLLRKEKLKKL